MRPILERKWNTFAVSKTNHKAVLADFNKNHLSKRSNSFVKPDHLCCWYVDGWQGWKSFHSLTWVRWNKDDMDSAIFFFWISTKIVTPLRQLSQRSYGRCRYETDRHSCSPTPWIAVFWWLKNDELVHGQFAKLTYLLLHCNFFVVRDVVNHALILFPLPVLLVDGLCKHKYGTAHWKAIPRILLCFEKSFVLQWSLK